MEKYFLTALQPDPVVAWYFLKFWKECVSKTGAHLYLFWSAGRSAQKNIPDCVWLEEVTEFFKREFQKLPNVRWYEEGSGSLWDKKYNGNFVTHFDAVDYMFGDVPAGSITVSYDSDVWWWDLAKLQRYLSLVENDEFDIVGTTPSGCGTQIHEEVMKRQPPENIHPCFVILKTDNMRKVRPQVVASAFGRPVRWRPYVWEPGDVADQFDKTITEKTVVDVFGWASIELIDRLKLNRFYEIKPSPRYQEVFDSFIGERGWVHPAATSALLYIWWTLFPGQKDDVLKWTRKRAIFHVSRQKLGLKRLLSDEKFMKLPTACACIDEAQRGLDYMVEKKFITENELETMTKLIQAHYPL